MGSDYRQYWNDIETEKNKPYYVASIDDDRLLNWLRHETNTERSLTDAIAYVETHLGGVSGRVLDVGAGVCWSSAIMANIDPVTQVVAIDFSEHRVDSIAPLVIAQFGADASRITRINGDFLNYSFEPASFDIVLFCQALYMFPSMKTALVTAFEVLKPGGLVIIACERIVPPLSQLIKTLQLRRLANRSRRMLLAKCHLAQNCDESGRFVYSDKDYRRAIRDSGFEYYYQQLDYRLRTNGIVLAGNHFGRKPSQVPAD